MPSISTPSPAARALLRAAPPPRLGRRSMNTLLLAALTAPGLAAAEPASAHPAEPTATPAQRVLDFDWVDATRARPVPVRLYWPAAATPAQPVPLVVFSHGIGGSRQGYSYLGRHWSAHGVASLHVQHVGSDATLWRGNPFGMLGRLQAAAQEAEALARTADLRFALDRMLSDDSGGLGAAVDRQRLVAAGHSYGANTTLLTVGAQVVRGGQVVDCRDARLRAAIVLSAPPFYGEPDPAAVLRSIDVPTVHVTCTDDVIHIPGYHSGLQDRLAIFDAIAHPRKLLAVFEGGSHSMFTDRGRTGGASLNAQAKRATAELGLAFLDLVFAQDGSALAQWQATWRPILSVAPGDPGRPQGGGRTMQLVGRGRASEPMAC